MSLAVFPLCLAAEHKSPNSEEGNLRPYAAEFFLQTCMCESISEVDFQPLPILTIGSECRLF
jgi:hypothetical protein